MSESRGKVRVGLEVALNERRIGDCPLSVRPSPKGPRSNSSQLKVSGCPSGSLPLAVSAKGVRLGMTKDGPASTIGAWLPVAVRTGQESPVEGVVVKDWISTKFLLWKYASLWGWRSSGGQIP